MCQLSHESLKTHRYAKNSRSEPRVTVEADLSASAGLAATESSEQLHRHSTSTLSRTRVVSHTAGKQQASRPQISPGLSHWVPHEPCRRIILTTELVSATTSAGYGTTRLVTQFGFSSRRIDDNGAEHLTTPLSSRR